MARVQENRTTQQQLANREPTPEALQHCIDNKVDLNKLVFIKNLTSKGIISDEVKS
jgi:hypothetical protein